MRFFVLGVMLFGFVNTLFSQETASAQLERKYLDLLQVHIKTFFSEAVKSSPQPVTSEQVDQYTTKLLIEAKERYKSFLLLSESEASSLLSKGPDDTVNRKAMEKYLGEWKKVQRPLPVLLKYLQTKVESGEISGGLDLDLVRRMSEFHLRELGIIAP